MSKNETSRNCIALILVILVALLAAALPVVAASPLEEINSAIAANPNDWSLYVRRARYYFDRNDRVNMQKEGLLVLSKFPRDVNAAVGILQVYQRNGDKKLELEVLNHLIKIAPDRSEFFLLRSDIEITRHMADQVIKDCTRSIELNPKTYRAYYLRGFAYHTKGDYRAALDNADEVLKSYPTYYDGLFLKYIALTGLQRLEEALVVCDQLIKAHPEKKKLMLLSKVDTLSVMGRTEDALKCLEEAEQAFLPEVRGDLVHRRAGIYASIGRISEGVAVQTRYLKAHPDDARMRLERAGLNYQLGRYDGAIKDCDDALRTLTEQADKARAYNYRALSGAAKQNLDAAMRDVNKSLSLEPAYAAALHTRGHLLKRMRRHREALADLMEARNKGGDDLDCTYHISEIFLFTKRADAAMVEVNAGLERFPNNSMLLGLRAKCSAALGSAKQADLALERSMALDPVSRPTRVSRILSLSNRRRSAEAVKLATELLAIDPTDAEVLTARGKVYLKLNSQTHALLDFTSAIGFKPDYAEAYFERGTLHKIRLEYDRALADFQNGSRLRPSDPSGHRAVATTLFEKGRFKDAVAEYSRAIKLDPILLAGYVDRAKAYAAMGESSLAIKDYETAIFLQPAYVNAYLGRATEFVKIKNYDAAIKDLGKVLEFEPNNGKALEMRAAAYQAKGKYQAAAEDYSRLIKRNPQFTNLYELRAEVYEKMGKTDLANRDRTRAKAVVHDIE